MTEDRLRELADSVSDGRPVDWDSASDEKLGPGVEGLRTLAKLAQAFDAEASPSGRPQSQPEAQPQPKAQPQPLFRWGHLDVLEAIGEGQFGEVFRAWDPQLGREVALKLSRIDPPSPVRLGLAEAKRLARVQHPNVLPVFGAGVHDGRAGIWTALLTGQTLERRLELDGRLGAGELVAIGSELCRALAAVHNAGLVHGDVKTSNVLRDQQGRFVLVDFGAAHLVGEGAPAVLQATPSYLAPEVASGDSNPTPSSDLYSLGAVLYRLATAEFWAADGPSTLRDARPDLPSELVATIESLLAADPGDRPRSAGVAERRLLFQPLAQRSTGEQRWLPWAVVAGLGTLVVAGSILRWGTTVLDSPATEPASVQTASAGTASAETEPDATLWAQRDGVSYRVAQNTRLRPGDRLSLVVDVPVASYVYAFNEDEMGEFFVLFPLPGVEPENPLPAGSHRLPGTLEDRQQSWEVTSAGGRERFLVVGSEAPMPELERFREQRELARPGREVVAGATETPSQETQRGVGGLADTKPTDDNSVLADLRHQLEHRGDAGLWTRFWIVDND